MTGENLEKIAREAETLMRAAAILSNLTDIQDEMIQDGKMEDDADSTDMREKIESAEETCELLSKMMTMQLGKRGFVPDFNEADADEAAYDGDDGDDSDEPIGFM